MQDRVGGGTGLARGAGGDGRRFIDGTANTLSNSCVDGAGFCYASAMSIERKEPTYLFTEKQVAEKSEIARRFIETRARLNVNVDKADNFLLKRFYNIDHNTYLEGSLPAKYKELMGLVVSAGLRCDDCINYHILQSYRLGVTRPEQEEALNVALVVGGSIVIPHLRRAYELLTELYG